jgi:hypothetical protein
VQFIRFFFRSTFDAIKDSLCDLSRILIDEKTNTISKASVVISTRITSAVNENVALEAQWARSGTKLMIVVKIHLEMRNNAIFFALDCNRSGVSGELKSQATSAPTFPPDSEERFD